MNDAVVSIESVGPLCRHRAKTKHQAKTKKGIFLFCDYCLIGDVGSRNYSINRILSLPLMPYYSTFRNSSILEWKHDICSDDNDGIFIMIFLIIMHQGDVGEPGRNASIGPPGPKVRISQISIQR